MNEINIAIGRAATSLNPLLGVVIAICGSVAGAVIANSPMGGIVGLLGGTALGLALCGNLALLSAVADYGRINPTPAARPREAVAPTMPIAVHMAAASPPGSKQEAGRSTAGKSGGSDGEDEHDTSATETEAELLGAGKFSAYHLAKAKRLFDSGNFKEAEYQAGASLAHEHDNEEARDLRKRARAERREK